MSSSLAVSNSYVFVEWTSNFVNFKNLWTVHNLHVEEPCSFIFCYLLVLETCSFIFTFIPQNWSLTKYFTMHVNTNLIPLNTSITCHVFANIVTKPKIRLNNQDNSLKEKRNRKKEWTWKLKKTLKIRQIQHQLCELKYWIQWAKLLDYLSEWLSAAEEPNRHQYHLLTERIPLLLHAQDLSYMKWIFYQ